MMSQQSRRELLAVVVPRYRAAHGTDRTRMLKAVAITAHTPFSCSTTRRKRRLRARSGSECPSLLLVCNGR